MILRGLGPVTAYRMHAPRWASLPISGAGAAREGGRANRKGLSALYLALDAQTAIREYQQLSTLMPPGTLVSYTVQVDPVVDFTGSPDPAVWAPSWNQFYCDWRDLWFNQKIQPPSWALADAAIAKGAKGILFGSRLFDGGTNLVLFTDHLTSSDTLSVFDPGGALPKNQDSWR